jgi:isocitrate lyase
MHNSHILELEHKWRSDQDVVRLRGSIQVNHTFAELGARRLWNLLQTEDYVAALGAMTGCQAVRVL